MPSAFDRVEFAPPAQPGMVRAMGLAILAHLLLVGALTWGVNWKSQSTTMTTAQAELWSSVPQQAAPRAALPPPAPSPVAKPEPRAEPKPTPPAPLLKTPDIVDKQDKPLPKAVVKPAEKPPELAKPEPAKPDPAIAKRDAQKEAQRKAAEDAAEREKDRQDAIDRSVKLAGSGAPDAVGTAPQTSGGSSATASDGNAIANIIKQNTSARSEFDKALRATFDIRISGSGQILSIRMVKSSGNPAWDDAALRGIELTREKGGIPGAIAARVPTSFPVNVSP